MSQHRLRRVQLVNWGTFDGAWSFDVPRKGLLLTGLVNEQVVRTAAMMDMKCIVLVRDKEPTAEMIELAQRNGIVMMHSRYRMYEACGLLFSSGLGRTTAADE